MHTYSFINLQFTTFPCEDDAYIYTVGGKSPGNIELGLF